MKTTLGINASMKPRTFSIDEQAGQRLMIGFDGLELSDQLKYYIEKVKVGGLILFSRNIAAPDQVRELCAAAQLCAAACGQPPLLIGIDQEGGAVSRLKPPFSQFSGNPSMTSIADAETFARITADELRQIGVTMNMAPVVDVADPNGPGIMRDRVFGADPQWVAAMGRSVIAHLQSNGILAVAKHFPGIGRTVLDSHLDLPDLRIDEETMIRSDLIPFQAAIEAQVAGIMLSHIRYTDIDPRWPASLSPILARDLLRRRLGFQGLVLSDDIDMGALSKHYPVPVIIGQCMAAEVDLILICHPTPKIDEAFDIIVDRLTRDEETARAGRESLARLLSARQKIVETTKSPC
jgi:beta-N-acetylhexosaminidase